MNSTVSFAVFAALAISQQVVAQQPPALKALGVKASQVVGDSEADEVRGNAIRGGLGGRQVVPPTSMPHWRTDLPPQPTAKPDGWKGHDGFRPMPPQRSQYDARRSADRPHYGFHPGQSPVPRGGQPTFVVPQFRLPTSVGVIDFRSR